MDNTCLIVRPSLQLKLNPKTEIIYKLTKSLSDRTKLPYELLTPFLIRRIHMGETATLDWLIVLDKHAVLSDFTRLLLLPVSKTLASSKYTL